MQKIKQISRIKAMHNNLLEANQEELKDAKCTNLSLFILKFLISSCFSKDF